jgi:hypothetical protein
MQPGIHDISIEAYHASDGLSRSALMLFKKSPQHYYNEYLSENKVTRSATPALLFGDALHTYVLEHDKFFDRYAFDESYPGKKMIKEDDYFDIVNIAQSLDNDPTAKHLISKAQYEKAIYWQDDDTGILCKCRPDILHGNMICDLKTTNDASEKSFKYSIWKYGYHIQAAMTLDGIYKILGKKIEDFIFIAVEKKAPFVIAVYILDTQSIEKGRDEYKELLVKYKDCLDKNEWPGYRKRYISIPNHAFSQ